MVDMHCTCSKCKRPSAEERRLRHLTVRHWATWFQLFVQPRSVPSAPCSLQYKLPKDCNDHKRDFSYKRVSKFQKEKSAMDYRRTDVRVRHLLSLHACLSVHFYLRLKAEQPNTRTHALDPLVRNSSRVDHVVRHTGIESDMKPELSINLNEQNWFNWLLFLELQALFKPLSSVLQSIGWLSVSNVNWAYM